jgi:photosystem II stability/assembly factor-like uncharacterized protein
MSFSSLLRTMRPSRARARARQKPTSVKLCLELLEDRNLLSSGITLSTTSWVPIGPAPDLNAQVPGYLPASGRIAAVAADPTNANTIYIAAAGGGVWKTTNGGTTWSPLTDQQASLSMGALALAPSNPNIIYAGTGEANFEYDCYYGRGVLKSTDAGATWTILTGNAGINEFDRKAISRILVNPTDPNTVYVEVAGSGENGLSGSYGLYKTSDGGTTWTNTTTSITTDPSANFTDAVFDPSNPQTIYVAVGNPHASNAATGLYKSSNGGATWSVAGNFPLGTGGVIKVAIAPSAPQTLFAAISDPNSGGLLEMVKTTDGGNTWTALTTTPNYLGFQGWYNNALAVDPSNASVVYVGGENNKAGIGEGAATGFLESTDGGNTWTNIATGPTNKSGPHTDQHAFVFDANGKLLAGNDGGIWRLDNPDPKNLGWTDINGNLNTIGFTGIALDPTNATIAYGGSQDNGTEKFTGSLGWTQFGNDDGGFVRVDPNHPSTVYFTRQFYAPGSFLRSDDGGVTWQSLMDGINPHDPSGKFAHYVMDPTNSSRLVLGTNRVYETTDGAYHWTPISAPFTNGWNTARGITGLGVAYGDPNTIYADVGSGAIFVTTDHGASWHERDIPGIANVNSFTKPLGDFAVDPTNEAIAYVTFDKFSHDLGGSVGHVFRTSDYGQHWTDISGNLPDTPTSAIVLDSRTNALYVGTDIGVYASNNGGATWAPFQTGMPNVRVVDLELCPALNILAVGTHGRGMWEISVPFPASAIASVAGLSSIQVGVPTLGSPMLSAAPAGGGATAVGDSLAVAAVFALPLPGQAVTLLLAATSPNDRAAPALARQAIDQFFTAIGREDGSWAFAPAKRHAQDGTEDLWGDVLSQAQWWQDPEEVFAPTALGRGQRRIS